MKHVPQPTSAQLEEIAAALDKSMAQLAMDIHKLATYAEASGNRGLSTRILQRENLSDYFLRGEFKDTWVGILFYNEEPYVEGWQCRKNPHWLDVWCARYGHLESATTICEDWKAIKQKQAEDAAKPKRETEKFEQGNWTEFTTDQIGLRLSFAQLMVQIHMDQRDAAGIRQTDRNSLIVFAASVWASVASRCSAELWFRSDSGDIDALHVLKEGLRRYFSADDIEALRNGTLAPTDIHPTIPLPYAPKVVHVRSEEWSSTPEDERVYIGRNMRGLKDTGWGNPYTVAAVGRPEAISMYEIDLLNDAAKLERLRELRGKRVLGCWCKATGRTYRGFPDEDHACHGDVIVRLLSLPESELDKLIEKAQGTAESLDDEAEVN